MRKYILTIVATLFSAAVSAASIGQWNTYLAYKSITDIEPSGEKVFVLASTNLYSYNPNDQSIETYDKANSLSDTGISFIAWCKAAKKLVIIYSNQNIDLMQNDGTVENNSSFYTKSMTENKTVYCLTISAKYAFIGTGFGVIKMDVANNEISATYNFGKRVNKIQVSGGVIFCNTTDGNIRGDMNDNLLDPANWTSLKSGENPTYIDDNTITTSNKQGYNELIAYDQVNKCYWSTQQDGKLQSWKEAEDGSRTITASGIQPDGPSYNYFTTPAVEVSHDGATRRVQDAYRYTTATNG